MNVSDYTAAMLRHRASLWEESSEGAGGAEDDGGGYRLGWSLVTDAWVNVAPQSARESVFAQRLEHVTSHRIVMRVGAVRPNAAMRVLFEGREFNVRGVIDVEERGRWYVLFCDEGVAV